MRTAAVSVLSALGVTAAIGLLVHAQGQAPPGAQAPGSPIPTFQVPADKLYPLEDKLYPLEDGLLRWPISAADKAYGAIDGRRLHQYVADNTAMSRRYRDQGHPQFRGRIIGTSADDESQQWLLRKFAQFGLSDVRLQTFDLAPQWMPQLWSITASALGKTVNLDSAQPASVRSADPEREHPHGSPLVRRRGPSSEAAGPCDQGIQGFRRGHLRGA